MVVNDNYLLFTFQLVITRISRFEEYLCHDDLVIANFSKLRIRCIYTEKYS